MSTSTESATPPPSPNPLAFESRPHITIDEYMKERVALKVKHYTDGGTQQKRWYRGTSLAAIIGSATVPVLISLNKSNLTNGIDFVLWATILSLIVTILVSGEKLFRFREHWRSKDALAAALSYEQLLFQSRAGDYGKKDGSQQQPTEDELFAQFVRRIEGLILEEKSLRIAMETDQPSTAAR